MTDERRRSPRKDVALKTLVIIDQRELSGNIVNISEHGAFVRFDGGDDGEVSESDTGRAVSLVIRDENPAIPRQGSICRYIEYRSYKYLAINFERLYD
jgi:hypothetical protein